jgi:hypothetical protein
VEVEITVLSDQILRVHEGSSSISIDASAIAHLSGQTRHDDLHVPRWDGAEMYQGPNAQVVAWFLLANAIGFGLYAASEELPWCIEPGDTTFGLDDPLLGVMAALGQAFDSGLPLADEDWLMDLEQPVLESLLMPPTGHRVLMAMPQRLEAIHEMGRLFRDLGGPLGLIEEAGQSVQAFSQVLARRCPTWEDSRIIQGHRIRFLERAMRCAAMLYGRFGGSGPGAFGDYQQLRVGGSRRIPQVLLTKGILVLNAEGTDTILPREVLLEGSTTEVEIRAATLHAIDLLRDHLQPRFPGLIALQVSSHLWRMSLDLLPTRPELQQVSTSCY